MKPNLTFAHGRLGEAVYLDGRLVAEGPRVHPSALAEALGLDYESVKCVDSVLEEVGGFPFRIEHLATEGDR